MIFYNNDLYCIPYSHAYFEEGIDDNYDWFDLEKIDMRAKEIAAKLKEIHEKLENKELINDYGIIINNENEFLYYNCSRGQSYANDFSKLIEIK